MPDVHPTLINCLVPTANQVPDHNGLSWSLSWTGQGPPQLLTTHGDRQTDTRRTVDQGPENRGQLLSNIQLRGASSGDGAESEGIWEGDWGWRRRQEPGVLEARWGPCPLGGRLKVRWGQSQQEGDGWLLKDRQRRQAEMQRCLQSQAGWRGCTTKEDFSQGRGSPFPPSIRDKDAHSGWQYLSPGSPQNPGMTNALSRQEEGVNSSLATKWGQKPPKWTGSREQPWSPAHRTCHLH